MPDESAASIVVASPSEAGSYDLYALEASSALTLSVPRDGELYLAAYEQPLSDLGVESGSFDNIIADDCRILEPARTFAGMVKKEGVVAWSKEPLPAFISQRLEVSGPDCDRCMGFDFAVIPAGTPQEEVTGSTTRSYGLEWLGPRSVLDLQSERLVAVDRNGYRLIEGCGRGARRLAPAADPGRYWMWTRTGSTTAPPS